MDWKKNYKPFFVILFGVSSIIGIIIEHIKYQRQEGDKKSCLSFLYSFFINDDCAKGCNREKKTEKEEENNNCEKEKCGLICGLIHKTRRT